MIEQKTLEQEVAQKFGKKFANRCATVFDNSQLPLVGGEFDGQKVKSRHLKSALLEILNRLDPAQTEIDSLRASLPKSYESLLLAGNRTLVQESYINGIGGQDFTNLPSTGRDLAASKQPSPVIRIVSGATTETPLRALSMNLPALVLMEEIQKNGLTPPQLQIIFANNISSRLNSLDTQATECQAKRLAAISRGYIEEFFPGLENSTIFLIDRPLIRGGKLREELLKLRRIVVTETEDETVQTLAEKGIKNGAVRTHTFYGAAHLLVHDTNLEEALGPILPEQPALVNPGTIISIGGHQEKFFYTLRHQIKPHLGPEYQTMTLQYFTRHSVPPYYMARDGDLSLIGALKTPTQRFDRDKIGAAAGYDLDYLETVSQTRGDLGEFLERQSKIHG